MLVETIYVLFTLYMVLILLRWFGPWLSFELGESRLRWATRLTDPPIAKLRAVLPPMGPFDVGPLAVLLSVWLLRELTIAMIFRSGTV